MKISKNNLDSFISHLEKQQHKGILIYGSDIGVIEFTENAIKQKLKHFEFIKVDLDGDQTIKDALNEILTPSFFGDRKFIRISGMDSKEPEFKSLLSALDGFDGVALIIFRQNLDAKSQIRKLCEDSNSVAVIACYADEEGEIITFIQKFFASKKLAIEPDALRWIAENFQENRSVLQMELEKLALYKLEGKITLAEATYVMDEAGDAMLSYAVNYFFSINKIKFAKEVEDLKKTMPASALITAIINYTFKLIEIMEERAIYKKTFDVILAEKFVFFKQIPVMKNHLSKWSLDMLNSFLEVMITVEVESRKNPDSGYFNILANFFAFLDNKGL